MKENTQKGQRYWGAGEVDRGGEGNPGVEKRNKKIRAMMAEGKKKRERCRRGKPWMIQLLIRIS